MDYLEKLQVHKRQNRGGSNDAGVMLLRSIAADREVVSKRSAATTLQ